MQRATATITTALEQYRFNDAVRLSYDFVWHDFCDWYVELAKGKLNHPETKAQTATLLRHVLEQSLRLLHPVMPFVTEELWQHVKPSNATESIMTAAWPAPEKRYVDAKTERAFILGQQIVAAIRNIRAEFRIPSIQQLQVHCTVPTDAMLALFRETADFMSRMSGSDFHLGRAKQRLKHAATVLVGKVEVVVPLEDVIDLAKERERLEAQLQQIAVQLRGLQGRLKNKEFLKKAPAEVIAKEKERATTLTQQQKALAQSIATLR